MRDFARLDRQLWDQGAASFLPHGLSGGWDDAAQPILLSTMMFEPGNILIADGEWREAALWRASLFRRGHAGRRAAGGSASAATAWAPRALAGKWARRAFAQWAR
jgi:DNA polymerase-3 subunit chi